MLYDSSIHKHIHYCILIDYYFDIDLNKENRKIYIYIYILHLENIIEIQRVYEKLISV